MTAALTDVPGPGERAPRRSPDGADRRSPWQEQAACRGAGIDLFFPVGSTGAAADETRRARLICAGCLVRQQCLDYALASGQQYGIWGGLDEQERRVMRQQRQKAGKDSVPEGLGSGRASSRAGSGRC